MNTVITETTPPSRVDRELMADGRVMGIPNAAALNKVIKTQATAPLAEVVHAINIKLNLSEEARIASHNHRLVAGRMLVTLRKRVEDDGTDWWQWVEGKFDRSRKDIEKLMRLASADDPDAVIQKERAQQKVREGRRPPRSVATLQEDTIVEPEQDDDDPPFEAVQKLMPKLTSYEALELRRILDEARDFVDTDLSDLVRVLVKLRTNFEQGEFEHDIADGKEAMKETLQQCVDQINDLSKFIDDQVQPTEQTQ